MNSLAMCQINEINADLFEDSSRSAAYMTSNAAWHVVNWSFYLAVV